MKENKETDMFGNEVRADDTICVIIPGVFPDSPNAEIAECSVFLDTDKNRLAYCYPDDKNMIYAIRWNRERFWLKGCKQIQPQPDPNLVKLFKDDFNRLIRELTNPRSMTTGTLSLDGRKSLREQFIDKYTPYLQPHNHEPK